MERTEASGFPDIPPPPATPPQTFRGIDLRVGKRLLWVGGAAYPLENIARVHTYMLMPKRWEATRLFLKRLGIILSVAFALTILGGITGIASQDTASTLIVWVWLGSTAALLLCTVEWLQVLSATPLYVLAVETSGPPMAVVTSADPRQLDQLVGSLVHAIEHPETEFHVTVDRLMVNPKNYYFGDNVNMYGGTGNVGVGHA
ncbi:DUF6232 family protein [Streptomyces hyaluromycini]|uniref:DUF6232 family protein n=1 Tax=Streptomyces hyaluromycini TaxID=1377993 RepID=UPI000B5CA90D|nr:DUF6232 family protein [Streptomyces hyaluromycini]